MSFPGAIHRCDIQESFLQDSDFGEPVQYWQTIASSVPCRVYNVAGGYVETGAESETIATTWKAMLPYAQTCTESHRIANVTDRRGTTLLSSALISLVNHDPGGQFHHKEAWLTEVRTHPQEV